jgi:hypothetical protein
MIVPIVDGRLYALVHPYELDGRPSSHPLDVRGVSTMNCFLLIEGDDATLISTGYSAHQDALLEDLGELLGDRGLSLVIPRVEYASMCNARPIADRFRVTNVYAQLPDRPSEVLNFRPEWSAGDGDGLRDAERLPTRPGTSAPVDAAGRRRLEFVLPQLRLLPNVWAYDRETRTLFTGDLFSWVWQDQPGGPWLLDGEQDDPTTPDRVEHFLLRNRYWWLAGAHTPPLRRWLAELCDRYDIDVVAPDHGCVLTGAAVARHVGLLDEALAAAASRPPAGVTAGRWPTTATTA